MRGEVETVAMIKLDELYPGQLKKPLMVRHLQDPSLQLRGTPLVHHVIVSVSVRVRVRRERKRERERARERHRGDDG
jgi:pantothenate kinase-related protein Tda10